MSDSLLPGIMSAAIVSVKRVIAVWTPITSVPRSFAIAVTATFMFVQAYEAMNWARASGRSILRGLTAASVAAPSKAPSAAAALDCVTRQRAGHAMSAPAALAELVAGDGKHLDPCLAHLGDRVRVPL